MRILGGEAFIDYFSDPDQSNKGQVIFMGNKEIRSEPMWGETKKISKVDAVRYSKSASMERGSAIVIAQMVDLISSNEEVLMKDIIEVNANRLISRPENLTVNV